MTTPIYDALAVLKSEMEATYDPAPQAALKGVWIYPQEYDDIDLTTLPVAVISENINVPVSAGIGFEGVKAAGVDREDWEIEVLVFLEGGGGMEFPSKRAAEVEAVHREYVTAMKPVLYPNMTLDGTVDTMGRDTAGGYTIFQFMRWHWTWDGRTYWGVRFVIPVSQFTNQVMGP